MINETSMTVANAQAKPIQIIKSDCLLATMTERSVSLQTNLNRELGRFDVGIVTWCAFKGWGQSPAVKGKRRCRMHGGTNAGAPKGNRNAYGPWRDDLLPRWPSLDT